MYVRACVCVCACVRVRVCVVCAAGDSTKLVFLDEPSSGMDPWARRLLWGVLEKAKATKTIVLCTHYMDEADILGDRIAVMSRGRLQVRVCCVQRGVVGEEGQVVRCVWREERAAGGGPPCPISIFLECIVVCRFFHSPLRRFGILLTLTCCMSTVPSPRLTLLLRLFCDCSFLFASNRFLIALSCSPPTASTHHPSRLVCLRATMP